MPQGQAENVATGDAAVPSVDMARHKEFAGDAVATHRGRRNDTGVAQGNLVLL